LLKLRLTGKKISEYKLAAGVMTGTSMDGIDVLISRVSGIGTATRHEDVAFESLAFPEKDVAAMRRIISAKSAGLDEICALNYRIAGLYRDAIETACEKNGLRAVDLDFAAVSGQTFYHIPATATLQLGDGAYLCNLLGVPVVWNFRASDIAAGGQGAPLVPYLDFALLSRLGRDVVTLNVGGISNVTHIPAGGSFNDVRAFDSGPGNMIIDRMTERYTGGAQKFDLDSKIAESGKVSPALLKKMLSHPYLKKSPPKSTGREAFGNDYADSLVDFSVSGEISYPDMIRTATEFTARCVADSIIEWIVPFSSRAKGGGILLLPAGGGARNPMLMSRLMNLLSAHGVTAGRPEDHGIDPRSKEALLMIILGNESIYLRPSNVPSATGAKFPVVTGTVSFPHRA